MSNQHAKYWLTGKAIAALDNHPPLRARVRVGSGTKVWTVAEYWTAATGELLATLAPVEGYNGTTVAAHRLRRADQ